MSRQSRPVIGIIDPYHAAAVKHLEDYTSIDILHRKESGWAPINANAEAVIIRSETRLDEAEFTSFQKLKYVIKQGVGVDNIDLQAAKAHGVQVYNTPGLNSEVVAELTLGMALSLARRIPEIDRAVRDGKLVVRSQTLGRSLYKKTLGVVGMGAIGTMLAKKWRGAMEGELLGYDPFYKGTAWAEMGGKQVESLHELLRSADVISLHLPLNKSTAKLISTAEFQIMKSDVIFLNCARGGIVDEDALLQALRGGQIGAAGLDAMAVEPPTKEHYGELLKWENVIMTPHIGSSTRENQAQSGLAVAQMAIDLVEGRAGGNRVV